MPKNIFRAFNPNAPPEDRSEKRRAQLRNAQQTYRERKDRYTKALEQELAVSRAREAHLFQENARLKETIQALQQGRTPPARYPSGPSSRAGTSVSSDRLAAFNFDFDRDLARDLDLDAGRDPDWPDFASVSNSLCSTPQIAHVTAALAASLRSASPTASTHPTSPASSAALSSSAAASASCCIGDVDATDLGMQFILKLEEPCLGHMHVAGTAHEATNVSNNHALTVTSRLADMGFTDGTFPAANAARAKDARQTRMIMQSMLALSKDLVLPHSGALTPVQAWQSVCAQPRFAQLPVSAVQRLGNVLRELVKCHGFGAVIEQRLFSEHVAHLLAAGAAGSSR